MPSVVDITGMKFGPWTVIEPAQRPAGLRMQGAFWLCECDCVRKTREVLNGARLRAGRGAKGEALVKWHQRIGGCNREVAQLCAELDRRLGGK